MNKEKYRDPTAETAISRADKWEKWQQELEEKHGIKRGDHITIIENRYASGRESYTEENKSQSKSSISVSGRTTAIKWPDQITYILGT